MTDRNARPPEKVHRAFVQTAKKVSPAQRKRDEEAADAAEYAAHQRALRAAMYERMGKRPPDPDRAADFADEFGGEAA